MSLESLGLWRSNKGHRKSKPRGVSASMALRNFRW